MSVDLESEIAMIGDLPREGLAQEWQRIYKHPPPKGLHRALLVRAVSWHLQSIRLGGFSVGTRRQLRSLADQTDRKLAVKTARAAQGAAAQDTGVLGQLKITATGKPRRRLETGARLIREWNGRGHFVDVVDHGFVYDGKLYTSLTAIAFAITGTHWSGPRPCGRIDSGVSLRIPRRNSM